MPVNMKIKVGLVFGGRSSEHEVSVRSAASIYGAMDKEKYDVTLLGIDKTGEWHWIDEEWLPTSTEMKSVPSGEKSIVPQDEKVDVVFPIVHGTYGEDGCIQGLLELMDVPYVGAGVLGSAVGMDKDVQKRLLLQAGIKVARYYVVREQEKKIQGIVEGLGLPVFVKPANNGSSVGVSKVVSEKLLVESIKEAFKHDKKVLVEEAIMGREIEVAVLECKDGVRASLPGEIIPKGHEFYDYEAKYLDEDGAQLVIPAEVTSVQLSVIRETAVKVFQILECSGMARVDMFLTPDGELVINEINTLPGFTNISMYPKLWEATGVPYAELINRLIEQAMDRKKRS